MLKVTPRKSREIREVKREAGKLFLFSEAGMIRLWPQTERMIRVSYTEETEFSSGQGCDLEELDHGSISWTFSENKEEILVCTSRILVRIRRATGSLRFEKPDGTLLLMEAEQESKVLEGFDVWRTVVNGNTQVEEIRTADGIKRRIRSAGRVLEGRLYHTRLSLRFQDDEVLYGLGQAEEGVWDLRHTTQYLHQANMKIAVPMLVSSRGYGILLSTQSPAIFSDTQYGSWFYTEADEYLDYCFLAGENMEEITAGYRQLTGRAPMLPKWAYGYIQSQERYETAEEILSAADRFREENIGLDAIVLDWMSWEEGLWGQKTFDAGRFAKPGELTERLHKMGIRFMLSVWPSMSEECDDFSQFREWGLILPGTTIYDAFSPEARRLYWRQAETGLFRHGVDAWWCDSCEPVTPEWDRAQRPSPEGMYREYVENAGNCMPIRQANAYGYYHAKGVYEGQRGSGSGKRVVNLIRSGYWGSQKYGAVFWSGDISASWETLKKQIAAGLHFSASGLPYWTLDIGAFFVKKGLPWYWNGDFDGGTEDYGYRELYVRWLQYGAFLPVFRSHGTDCRREPWNFGGKGEPFYEAILSAIRLRYRLMPYIYSLAGQVWHDNRSMMRPLVSEFPKDDRSARIMDQYMFGPSLMVCPVTAPMYYQAGNRQLKDTEKSRQVWLPGGCDWYDLRTDERYAGGQTICARADIDSIPVFVRAGSILPVAEPGLSTDEMEGADICLRAYSGADGGFTMYEDAGDGYGYEEGEYCLTYLTYHDAAREVEWHSQGDMRFRKGNLSAEIIG